MAVGASETSVQVKVTLPSELVGRLNEIAKGRGIGLSTLVRMLLYASLER